MSSSEAVSVTLTPGREAAEAVTRAVEAVVDERVLTLPGSSSVEPDVVSVGRGSEACGCVSSAEVDGGAGTDGPGAADSGSAVARVESVGCSGIWLAVTIGVFVNKLTSGSGENNGRLDEPSKLERLKSPVASGVITAGGVASVAGGVKAGATAGARSGTTGVAMACAYG